MAEQKVRLDSEKHLPPEVSDEGNLGDNKDVKKIQSEIAGPIQDTTKTSEETELFPESRRLNVSLEDVLSLEKRSMYRVYNHGGTIDIRYNNNQRRRWLTLYKLIVNQNNEIFLQEDFKLVDGDLDGEATKMYIEETIKTGQQFPNPTYNDLPADTLLGHIRRVGTQVNGIEKLIGYLPLDIIEPKTGKSAKEIAQEFKEADVDVLILSGPESRTEKGAIYVYHKEKLQMALNRFTDFLQEEGWSTDAEVFVRQSGEKEAMPGTALHYLIDYIFADKIRLGNAGEVVINAVSNEARKKHIEYTGIETNENLQRGALLDGVSLNDAINVNKLRKGNHMVAVNPRCLHHKYEDLLEIVVTEKGSGITFILIQSRDTGKIYLHSDYMLKDDIKGTKSVDAAKRTIHNDEPFPYEIEEEFAA